MPTKLSHLLYRLVGRDPPDRWVDRSMMQPRPQPHNRSWTQSFLSPRPTAGNNNNTNGSIA